MHEVPFKAKNNREAVVVCAIHVVKRPSKRSVLVSNNCKCMILCYASKDSERIEDPFRNYNRTKFEIIISGRIGIANLFF